MRTIILFYKKAKGYTQLVQFYSNCSQLEIDEYQDYEKALKALKEGEPYVTQCRGEQSKEVVSMFQKSIQIVERVVSAQKGLISDSTELLEKKNY